MESGKWGTWALLAPRDEDAFETAKRRVELAFAAVQTVHPNLTRTQQDIIALGPTVQTATQAAQSLVNVDVVVADVTNAPIEIMYLLGARDLIADRLTIALHEGAAGQLLRSVFGDRLVELDERAPEAAQQAVSRIISAASRDHRYSSALRARIGDYKVARLPRVLGKASAIDVEASLHRVKCADGAEAKTAVGLWWGDVASIDPGDEIHALVNSENTFFEMGRIHDKGLSAVIRYLGATWWGDRCDDRVYRELLAKVPDSRPDDREGMVIVTSAGRLRARSGIRHIAHVAAVRPRRRAPGDDGPPSGLGCEPIENLSQCIVNVLDELFPLLERQRSLREPTILFPLIGTGNAGGNPRMISRVVIEGISDYVASHPNSGIKRVLVSAYSDMDRALCNDVFDTLVGAGKLIQISAGGEA